MAKYVFLPTPTHGHVNPTLAVAQELVRRGEQVVYYLTEAFQATNAQLMPSASLRAHSARPHMNQARGGIARTYPASASR